MALNQQSKSRAIKGFERRLKALIGENPLPYKLHEGHWIRDVITMLAILNDASNKTQLINNLPIA